MVISFKNIKMSKCSPIPFNRLLSVFESAQIEPDPKENIPGVWDVRFIFSGECILMISFSAKHPDGNFWWQFDPPPELTIHEYGEYLVLMTFNAPILANKAKALVAGKF